MDTPERLRIIDPLNAEWVTLLLVVVLAMLAWTNMNAPRKWRLLAQAMFRLRLGRQAMREELDTQDRTLLGLLAVAVAVIALFLWQAVIVQGDGAAPPYAWMLGGVAAAVLAQALLAGLLSWLFQGDGGLREYLVTGLLLLILLGMCLLPLSMLIAYRSAWRPGLVVVGLVLLVLSMLYRWMRGL